MTNAHKLNWRGGRISQTVTLGGNVVASIGVNARGKNNKWSMCTITGRATGYIYESADEAKAEAEQELLNMARLITAAFAS